MKHQLKKLFAAAAPARSKIVTCMAAMSFLGAAISANAQYLNGTLDAAFYGSPLYVQTINTGFGNSTGGGDASGSELDAVYAKVSGGNLYLFIAGCFQNNGNHLNVFIDGGAAGQTNLAVPTGASMAAMNGSIFRTNSVVFGTNFYATWAFDMNDSSGTLYSEEYSLTGVPSGGYVGALAGAAGIFAGSDGGVSLLYLNNTLVSTMGTANAALSGAGSGANTTTGLEMVIPTADIGYTGGAIDVTIDINGGSDGYLSNQFLPGLAVGTANLGGSTFNFGPPPAILPPTNNITFQIDMSAQVLFGNFTNNVLPGDNYGSTITVSGNFEGWDNGKTLTNNPTLLGNASNQYSAILPVVGFLPYTNLYKFRMNGGWENNFPTPSGNRTTIDTSSNQVLPLVFYNDESVYDLLASTNLVTFTLYCPDGTVDDGGYVFTKGFDTIYINGAFFNADGTLAAANSGVWWGWAINAGPAADAMVEVGNTDTYTNSFTIPKGNGLTLTYKYSFDGADDENGFNTNHIREIRTLGPTYAFPTDVWSYTVLQPNNGNPYPNPGISPTNIVEPDFGYLAIGAPEGGSFPITWLGRPYVVLENESSLTSGSWNINNVAPAYASVTNWPNAGSAQFFRLLKY